VKSSTRELGGQGQFILHQEIMDQPMIQYAFEVFCLHIFPLLWGSTIARGNYCLCVVSKLNVACNRKISLITFYESPWIRIMGPIDSICIAWRRGVNVRKVRRLPNTTHSSPLSGISNTMPLIDLLYRRLLKFVYRCLSRRSCVLNFIARHSILFRRHFKWSCNA